VRFYELDISPIKAENITDIGVSMVNYKPGHEFYDIQGFFPGIE
jgi:hypothetical protein